MSPSRRLKVKIISFAAYWAARLIAGRLRLQVIGEHQIDAERERSGGGVILATWHGRTFVPITRFRKRNYWAMISTSRDGEYQNNIFQRFGFNTVRGSTSARGAVTCALKMAKELKQGAVLAHTPDGPRGPSHIVHPGAIFLAEKSGCSIIPAGVSAWPRWELPTWDRYIIPMPFARAALIYGAPIHIPPSMTDAERKAVGESVARAISELEVQAERLVQPGRDTGRPQQGDGFLRAAG